MINYMARLGTLNLNTLSYRWDIAVRCVLAFLGGFLWASVFGAMCAALFSRLGWMPLIQGVHVMTLFSFLPWCGVAMWAFYESSLNKIAVWLTGSSVLMYCVFLLVN